MAGRIGKSPYWMNRRMAGEVSFKLGDLGDIANVFGTSVSELLTDAEKIADPPTERLEAAEHSSSATSKAKAPS